MGTEAFTIRSDSKKVKQLDRLANQMDRSRNYLVNQAIDNYLQNEAHHLQELAESIQEAETGKLVTHDSVMAEISDIIEKHS